MSFRLLPGRFNKQVLEELTSQESEDSGDGTETNKECMEQEYIPYWVQVDILMLACVF